MFASSPPLSNRLCAHERSCFSRLFSQRYWLHSSHFCHQFCFMSIRLCHYLWLISWSIIISIPSQCILSSFKYNFSPAIPATEQCRRYILLTEYFKEMWNDSLCLPVSKYFFLVFFSSAIFSVLTLSAFYNYEGCQCSLVALPV